MCIRDRLYVCGRDWVQTTLVVSKVDQFLASGRRVEMTTESVAKKRLMGSSLESAPCKEHVNCAATPHVRACLIHCACSEEVASCLLQMEHWMTHLVSHAFTSIYYCMHVIAADHLRYV